MERPEVLVHVFEYDECVTAVRDGHGTLLVTAPVCRSLLRFMLRPPPGGRTPERCPVMRDGRGKALPRAAPDCLDLDRSGRARAPAGAPASPPQARRTAQRGDPR
ncbi:hypothetical protein GCM10019017_22550 [Streptomyces showdoensis]